MRAFGRGRVLDGNGQWCEAERPERLSHAVPVCR